LRLAKTFLLQDLVHAMDMSKYREMFLTEAREHLGNMSRTVVTLEKDPSNREGIDSLFRHAHSIKGMAASMGYERTAELAHCLEDLMDGFRKTGTVPPEAVDRLLDGIDLLEGLLEDLESGSSERGVSWFLSGAVNPDPLVVEQSRAVVHEPPSERQPEEYRVILDLRAGTVAPAARLLLILRELKLVGEVVSSSPNQEQLAGGQAVNRLDAKLKTVTPPEALEALLRKMPDVESVAVSEPLNKVRTAIPSKDEGPRTVRVSTDLLDRFINLTGELITNRYMLQTAFFDESWPKAREGLNLLSRLITDLHHQVLQVRMMPIESITGRLPRLVRELSRKTGKVVDLHIEGEGVQLDRAILEELADPLMHMTRNAIDHGIESEGCVSVSARREKDMVILEVADDGKGMDAELIRRKAVEKGLLSPAQAKTLKGKDALQLVCLPGFSTASTVTETSGRGVGMDVVKAAIERLGGALEIHSQPGEGTRFRLTFPLSVAIIQVLLVESASQILAIPITRVYRTLEIDRSEIHRSGKQTVFRQGEEIIPLISLRKALHFPPNPPREQMPVVLTEARGRKFGLLVDRLVGQRVVFVKTLAFPLDRLKGVSGATVLGDGSVVFIVDPQTLLEGRLTLQADRPEGDL